jgi:hypothetical protein
VSSSEGLVTHEARAPEDRAGSKEDWSIARPEIIPRPTAWPAGVAFGITFLMWSLLTSTVLSVAGLAVLVASLAGWIGEIRHEERRS